MELPRILNSQNIDNAILLYKEKMASIPFVFESHDIVSFLKKIKRERLQTGPYPNVTLFESANRIMTDLTILYGIRELLNNKIPEINFDNYEIEYGNGNKRDHDVMAENSYQNLIGEAFNVAPSFFHVKKYASLKKLRRNAGENTLKLLIYNADAVKADYKYKSELNEWHLTVDIDI